ncbi:lyso-ornithine lipid acyltransferase [Crenobacter luteus]|uniref:Acyl-phosphate glycerol 3-phosphate acyltransferase n=1 Tax=Crenobacter luteus TaxID=1452487 RepID=A0A165FKX4_9NEIS|nr:lysophospholipid acyltransferase family protein [Crenobacter luteus]KZE33584.1 acyl-phosphate glycerol 3-phosphate acyltransferase [Crenobacter luteus]TCP10938.1 lyso-ornithine lipid acyltransferase [Crenobacter luteus]
MSPALPRTSVATRAARLGRLAVHLARGLVIVAGRFRHMAHAERAVVNQRWSRGLLRILGVQLHVRGVAPGVFPPNTLLVANHVSWLDIFALNSVTVSRFVAKREILKWPVAGWLVKSAGTLFIDRSNRRDASRVNQQLARALENGGCMAVFPEATTSDGSGLLPFKASLFESAMLSRATVQPVTLRYLGADGAPTTAPAYVGDTSFWQSLCRILGQRSMTVELSFGAPLAAGAFDSRFTLCEAAREQIEATLTRSPAPQDTAAKTAAGLPA